MGSDHNRNWGILTAGLALVAVGTVGPFALALFGLLAVATKSGALMLAAAGVGLMGLIALINLGLLGQLLCLFSPLSQGTKTPLAISLGCVVVAQFVTNPGGVLGFVSLIAFLFFLYGLCRDLEAPELTSQFNQAAGFGLMSLLCGFFGGLSAVMLGGMGVLLGMLASLAFGALAFARYAQTIIDLAFRANGIRVGTARPPGAIL